MKQIPNLFTLLNLLFGCIAITYILQNGITSRYSAEGGQYFIEIPEKIFMASFYIALAAVVDFLDGFVARLFNASSEMGKQLDSLADLVSFGVAPSMIIYQYLRLAFARQPDGLDVNFIFLIPAFFIAVAAAYRLARFNLDNSQQYGFKGIPVPAAGLLIASFPLIYWNTQQEWLISLFLNKWVLYAFVVIICGLMVSRIPMMALKFTDLSLKNNLYKYLLIGIAIVAVLLLHWIAVPLIFIVYILLSLLANKTQRV